MKYSCALWNAGTKDLAEAEEAMLDLTCRRACLEDGQDVLELGCGWGSLSLFMARRFPNSRILAVSNSRSQKQFIDSEAARRGLANLTVVTADMNEFSTDLQFDRIVSVEMFEHMRNYAELLRRIASWSRPGALLFVHVFSHSRYPYPYEVHDASDWMAQHFFTGGVMPSDDLLLYFQEHFRIREHWRFSGVHYQKTSEAWLERLDRRRNEVLDLFAAVYGNNEAKKWLVRWRVFFMACAELFGFAGGNQWIVSHYLFENSASHFIAGQTWVGLPLVATVLAIWLKISVAFNGDCCGQRLRCAAAFRPGIAGNRYSRMGVIQITVIVVARGYWLGRRRGSVARARGLQCRRLKRIHEYP